MDPKVKYRERAPASTTPTVNGKCQISLYVTPEQRAAIDQVSKTLGKSNSGFVLQAVILHLRDLAAQAEGQDE